MILKRIGSFAAHTDGHLYLHFLTAYDGIIEEFAILDIAFALEFAGTPLAVYRVPCRCVCVPLGSDTKEKIKEYRYGFIKSKLEFMGDSKSHSYVETAQEHIKNFITPTMRKMAIELMNIPDDKLLPIWFKSCGKSIAKEMYDRYSYIQYPNADSAEANAKILKIIKIIKCIEYCNLNRRSWRTILE